MINAPNNPAGAYRVAQDVVGVTARKKDVLLSYTVDIHNRAENGDFLPGENYKVSFEIDPETQRIRILDKDSNYNMSPGAEHWNGSIPKVKL